VLPIGVGRGPQPHSYSTNKGLLVDGSAHRGSWNPFSSGRTFVYFQPFYQRRTLEIDSDNIDLFPPEAGFRGGDDAEFQTNGVTLGLEYDNRDFATNPSRGSLTKLNVTRDFGVLDSFNSWTSIDFSFSKYWDLGESDKFASCESAIGRQVTEERRSVVSSDCVDSRGDASMTRQRFTMLPSCA
jgi:hypothetical protein